MMNDAGSHSEHFEELCALAASGQISESEFVELSDHLPNCNSCKSIYGDFIDLVHYKLPLADPELTGLFRPGRPSLKESSYRERFVARARKEGLAVSREALRGSSEGRPGSSWFFRWSFAQVAPLAMVLLVVTTGILGYAWRQSDARNAALAAEIAAVNGQKRSQVRPEPGPSQVPAPENRPDNRSLPLDTVREAVVAPASNSNDTELTRLRQDYAAALASAKAAEERLQKVSGDLEAVTSQLTGSRNTETQLRNSLIAAGEANEKANQDLRIAREDLKTSIVRIEDESRQIQESKMKLTASIEPKERRNVLFAEGQDVRDQLLDLRYADVHDIDSKGKESRASARVFFSAGKSKSLLIIASGLSGRAANGKVFQVWGAHGASGTSARSLGTLEVDKVETDLWALRVNDPSKLKGIDTVFVTLEKYGGSEKPTSKQLMYAYLPQIPAKQ